MPDPTYRLETFGKLTLSGGASIGSSHQRRRLALLALLASPGPRGLSRDQLLAYLWSDSSAANARHSLDQQLHAMRRAFGDHIFTGVNPVCLNPGVIASDVNEFEDALAAGDPAVAVSVYKGPFLSGFYLDGAAEFERWTASERARLAARYLEALDLLSADAATAGDHSAAVRWRRLAVEADPLSSRSALALMRALAEAGDRTAALQHARNYEALVQQEFQSPPDPSVTRYAEVLRSASGDKSAEPTGPGTGGRIDPPLIATPRAAPPAGQTPTQTTASPVSELSTRSGLAPARAADAEPDVLEPGAPLRSRLVWLGGIAICAALAMALVLFNARRDAAPVLDSGKIVVVPFRVTGGNPSLKYLGEGVADLIAPMLTGEGGPIAVDSRTAISTWHRITRGRDGTATDARQVARELGAGLVLFGALVEVDGKLTITGSVLSGGAGNARPLTSVSGPVDSVGRLVDRLASQLLAQQSGVAETSLSAITRQSLPAIRAYLNGRAAYRAAADDRAIESFTRALDMDSTFALAALDLAVATGKVIRQRICRGDACRVFSTVPGFAASERVDDLFDRGIRLAWEHRSQLGKRDRPLLDALRGDNYPGESSARATLTNLRSAVAAAPDRPEAHYLLGILLLYQGPALGLTDSRATAEGAFREALKLDAGYLAPLARMVDAAAFAGDTARLRRAGFRYLARDSVGATPDYVRWILAAATRDSAAQSAIRSRLRSFDLATLEQIFVSSQMTGFGIEDADSASTIIIESTTEPINKSVAYRRAQILALNRGRPSAATNLLRRMDHFRPQSAFAQFAIPAAIFDGGDRAVADSSARHLSRTFLRDGVRSQALDLVTRSGIAAIALAALWHLDSGDTTQARASIAWLRGQREVTQRERIFRILPDMLIASRTRRADGAALRSLVDSVALQGCCSLPEFVIPVLAQSYEASGDDAAALRVIRRGAWFWPPRMLAALLRDEGRLSAKLGDRVSAIRAYEHYLALRSDPEPSMLPERDRIRAEVQMLKRSLVRNPDR